MANPPIELLATCCSAPFITTGTITVKIRPFASSLDTRNCRCSSAISMTGLPTGRMQSRQPKIPISRDWNGGAMEKIDYKQVFKHLYLPSAKAVVEVVVPPMNFLMADGAGDPNTSPDYQAVVEALFSTAYAVKFMVKKGPTALDYGVMPLEGLGWGGGMNTLPRG